MRNLSTELGECLRMALNAIASHRLRSALTMLGVLVGVFSIILVMTAMRAMQNNIEKELGQLGSRTFVVQRLPGVYFGGPEGFMKYNRRREITYLQALALKKKMSSAAAVGIDTTFSTGELTSPFHKTPPNVALDGVTPGTFAAYNWTIINGRPLIESDIDSARDVCVLRDDVATTLFPRGDAIGKRVKSGAIAYTVVGVFERMASSDDARGYAVIPITTGLNRYGRRRDLGVLIQAHTAESIADTMEQARGAFRAIRKVRPADEDDFEMLSSDSMIKQFQQVTSSVRIGLALVSSIALVAAGVGIMNIMLVSVTERTREIGIRRAIGATKRNIMVQFIMEAIVLCEIGGILGIALGMGGANLLAIHLLKLPPAFPVDWAISGLLICSAIGVVFGSYPAYKAANLDPIESLRYE